MDKETLLFEKLPSGALRCNTCQRTCILNEGQWGYCKTRINKNGKIYSTIYGSISSVFPDPIEKKPVFHFKPNSRIMSFGTLGCNFRCKFCQNWDISYATGQDLRKAQEIMPEKAVEMTKKLKCEGVAWTYNEPSIWLEYTLDTAKLAKKENIYTCYVTNGFATKEHIDLIAPYLDIYRVDLKSFDKKFYRELINVVKFEGVYENTKYVKDKYPEIHIECVTNVIPSWNDSEENLKKIAEWIVKNLGKKTPWHVSRFHPDAQLLDVPETPLETLSKAKEIGEKAGLEFVYIGNAPAIEDGENTYCPNCKKLVIERSFYSTKVISLKEGKCGFCGEDLNIRV